MFGDGNAGQHSQGTFECIREQSTCPCGERADKTNAHCAGEALLIGADGILDKIEVDVGDLEDIERQVAFKYTGSAEC